MPKSSEDKLTWRPDDIESESEESGAQDHRDDSEDDDEAASQSTQDD